MANNYIPGISAPVDEPQQDQLQSLATIDPAAAQLAQVPQMNEAQLGAIPSKEQLAQLKQLPTVSPADISPVPSVSIGKAADWLMQPTFQQPAAPTPADLQLPQITPETLQGPSASVKNLTVPTQNEVDKAHNEINRGLRESNAITIAEAEANKEAADLENIYNQRKAEVNKQLEDIDNRARTKSLPEILSQGTFMQKFGAALALGLGAVSQGLSGAKTNPVLDYLDKAAEQQAQKDKLSQEEKESLRRHLYQEGQSQIQRLEANTNNRYRKESLALERQKLADAQTAIRDQMAQSMQAAKESTDMWSGRPITDAEYSSLKSEDKDRVINLLDGRKVLVSSSSNAREWATNSKEIYNALDSIKQLKEMAQGGWTFKKWSAAKPLLVKLAGGLRLPYTGPGVLTDTERAMLLDAIGNPMNPLSIKSLELAKIGQVERDLNANLQNLAKTSGVRAQLTPEAYYKTTLNNGKEVARTENELVNEYLSRYPGLSKETVTRLVREKFTRLDR